MSGHALHVTLRLKTIDHLFEEPDLSPFDPYYAPYSFSAGVDYLVGEMRRSPGARSTELTVLLPPGAIAPGIEPRTREAIGRYAEAWANSARQERTIELLQARRVLIVTLLFFVVANIITIQHSRTEAVLGLSGLWVDVLVEGLSIASWVALWWPLDQLMHAVWLQRQDERAYQALRGIDLRILPDPAADDATASA